MGAEVFGCQVADVDVASAAGAPAVLAERLDESQVYCVRPVLISHSRTSGHQYTSPPAR